MRTRYSTRRTIRDTCRHSIKELCLSSSTNRLPDVSQVQLLEHSESSSKNPVPVPVCQLSIPRDRCDFRLQRSDPSRDDVKPSPLVVSQVYPSAHSVRNKLLQETPLHSSDSRVRLSYAAQVSADITRPSAPLHPFPRDLEHAGTTELWFHILIWPLRLAERSSIGMLRELARHILQSVPN
ncbi:hypothetical protein M404DRAFT_292265 [Pisolithus tinctorius Marx 270]|uniref:Uncharacterized protein n=1 Tax=Pisolithus tinctorius Marx 270 TaxID=870435 RepID=A0A0C3NL12_PISTI|nr:hypothetical protein M404DRAFT_292265 [Pisolithus tinctorius Marx 270]